MSGIKWHSRITKWFYGIASLNPYTYIWDLMASFILSHTHMHTDIIQKSGFLLKLYFSSCSYNGFEAYSGHGIKNNEIGWSLS